MRRFLRLAGAAGIAALCTGCFNVRQTIILNPDASGKTDIEMTVSPFRLDGGGGDEGDGSRDVRRLIEQTAGVDAWKNVSWRRTDDGAVAFRGTAYFRNLAAVKVGGLGMDAVSFERDASGRGILSLAAPKDRRDDGSPGLSDEEAARKAAQARAQYNQMKPFIAAMLGNVSVEQTFRLPGTLESVSGFTRAQDGGVIFSLSGARILAIADEVMADTGLMRAAVRSGKSPLDSNALFDAVVRRKLFGGAIPRAVATDMRPAFDYGKEVAAARPEHEKLLEKLGIAAVRQTATPDAPVSPRVSGVWVRRADADGDERMYAVSFSIPLPAPDTEIAGGRVEKAVADTGEDILPDKDWGRRIMPMRSSRTHAAADFDVHLRVPRPDARAIREISGTLEYLRGEGEKRVDLGIASFTAGARGTRLDAAIRSLSDLPQGEGQTLQLSVGAARRSIRSVEFRDAAGAVVEATQSGAWGDESSTTYTFSFKRKLPPAGAVVVTMYESVEKRLLPFRAGPFSLLGEPLNP